MEKSAKKTRKVNVAFIKLLTGESFNFQELQLARASGQADNKFATQACELGTGAQIQRSFLTLDLVVALVSAGFMPGTCHAKKNKLGKSS